MDDLFNVRDRYFHDITYICDHVMYLENFFLSSICMIYDLETVSPTFFEDQSIKNICNNNAIKVIVHPTKDEIYLNVFPGYGVTETVYTK